MKYEKKYSYYIRDVASKSQDNKKVRERQRIGYGKSTSRTPREVKFTHVAREHARKIQHVLRSSVCGSRVVKEETNTSVCGPRRHDKWKVIKDMWFARVFEHIELTPKVTSGHKCACIEMDVDRAEDVARHEVGYVANTYTKERYLRGRRDITYDTHVLTK